MPKTARVALSAILIALGVVLSVPGVGTFPLGPTKVYPFQHMINVITGIFLGPGYSVLIAFAIGLIRNGIGTGTVFAFPGGIFGAVCVSLIYRKVKSDLVSFTEPIGTAIGAFVSAFFVAPLTPLIGQVPPSFSPFLFFTAQWQLFLIFFWMSSIPGTVIGYIVVVTLRKRRVFERIPL